MNQRPIFITGCPRSGTSIIAGVLSQAGVLTGRVDKMYEDIDIREKVMKPFLTICGIDKEGQYPLPIFHPSTVTQEMGSRWKKKMGYYMAAGKWMYKDSRLLLINPLLDMVYPGAIWIVVRRETQDIINSCMQTGYMDAFNSEEVRLKTRVETIKEGWAWWESQYAYMINELKNSGALVYEVWPQKMVEGNYQQMEAILKTLGIECDTEKLRAFIEPKLWKSIKKENNENN